ncbi:Uncharacterised protein [uncultured archaeon]|nr:Uncharacterised protein [uncultured archaeon]
MSPLWPAARPGSARAQASTEYLIVLALVLTLALVVLGAFGIFPSFSFSAQTGDSARYWATSASPFLVPDFKQTGSSLSVVLSNSAPVSLILSSASLKIRDTPYSTSTTLPLTLPPGGRARLDFTTQSCSGRQVLGYDVNFTYQAGSVSGLYERGAKPLYVQCVD